VSEQVVTRHALARMSQRGIGSDDLALITLIGTEVEGGYFVRDKDCQAVERELKHLIDRVRRLRGKRVVVSDNHVISAYHTRRNKERRLLRAAEQRCL